MLRLAVAVFGRHALGQLHGAAQDPPELALDPLRAAPDRLRGGARTVAPAGNEPQPPLLGHRGIDLPRLRWRQAGLKKTVAGIACAVCLTAGVRPGGGICSNGAIPIPQGLTPD